MKQVFMTAVGYFLLANALGALGAEAPSGFKIKNASPAFEMTIPRGYQALPPAWRDALRVKGYLYGFIEAGATPDTFDHCLVILIAGMGGTIKAGERMSAQQLAAAVRYYPPGTTLSAAPVKILGFDNDMIRAVINAPVGKLVVFQVQVPLAKEAIQVAFRGPASREAETRDLCLRTMATVTGTSDYEYRSERLGYLLGFVTSLALGLALILKIQKMKKAPSRRPQP